MPRPEPVPLLRARRTPSADGTMIAYYATESPRVDASVVVLAAGLGGHHRAWLPQIRYFSDRLRFITWDYRGLFGSSSPVPATPEAHAVARQLDDLVAVLAAEQVQRFSLAGWSMGVQIALEAFRFMPDRIVSLVLVSGAPGRPLDVTACVPAARRLLGRLVGRSTHGRHLLAWATRDPRRRRHVAVCLRRMGFVGPSVDQSLFEQVVADLAELDMTPVALTLRALAEHDASAVLPMVTVPTLVIAGDQDPFNPPAFAHHMARQLPRSEIFMIRGGRHYLCLEFPDLVNLRLERFFDGLGLSPCGIAAPVSSLDGSRALGLHTPWVDDPSVVD